MENYILIGFSASGKSTVGKILAKKLKYDYVSTDELVEKKVGTDTAVIIKNNGKDYFATIEKEIIQNLVSKKKLVIDIGSGGAVRNPKDVKKLGKIIFLKADIKEIERRILNAPYKRDYLIKIKRLAKSQILTYIRDKMAKREPIYSKIADLTIDTTNKTPKEIIEIILRK